MASGKLVLIDGHSLAYRAFHALPQEMSAPSGEPTNATFGFMQMLLTVLEQERPDYVIVTFDKGPSFRVAKYEAYKAHREKMPEEMRQQMERIRELVEAFGFPIVELDDYEADDLLGTLAKQAAEQGLDVVIVTGDRDALQLVDEHITVLTSGRRFSDTIRYALDDVREKYGLEPKQLIDLKALMGDRSDNIPGVRGVGEKGAIALLKQYGMLDELYAHLADLSPRYRRALIAGREDAYLSRDLATIDCHAPVELDLESARVGKGFDRDRVMALMRELGFRSLVPRIPVLGEASEDREGHQLLLFEQEEESSVASRSRALGKYEPVVDEAQLRDLCARLSKATAVAVDTETTGLDAMRAELVGISLTDAPQMGWYLPLLAPAVEGGQRPLDLETIQRHLAPILANGEIEKRGHNLKYDMKVLERFGLPVSGRLFDTMVAEWILNPDSALGLKSQAWIRLGLQMTEITDLIGKGQTQTTMDHVTLDTVVPYACADADIAFRLADMLEPELREREQLTLFRDLEMPLLHVLKEMELRGIKVDLNWLRQLSEELSQRLAALEARIHQRAGRTFNINSTQQLSQVLFEDLGLPARGIRKTKSGHYSTRASVLENLRGLHPIIDDILAYRELAKLKSTYVDALPSLVNPETGRVHTSYNPTGTVTGRISSTNPNLQNIPIRTEEGRRVRRAFVAEDGCLLFSADYSQVELRVMAHISKDPGLIEAFKRDEDIHATTAAAIYQVPLDAVTYEMRSTAKAVNFGLIYGQSAFGLARQLGIPVEQAQAFIDRYFERFPRVRDYMQCIQAEAAERGYVETLLRRRRYFPELQEGSRASSNQRQAALRMAINMPIQGSAADIIKLAMLRLHRMLREQNLGGRMLLQVHDEVVLEVPEGELQETSRVVHEAMEHAIELDVALKIDVEVGPNWLDMHPE